MFIQTNMLLDNRNSDFFKIKHDENSSNSIQITNVRSQKTDIKLQQNQEQDQQQETRKSKLIIQGLSFNGSETFRDGSQAFNKSLNPYARDDKDSSVQNGDQDQCSDMSPIDNMTDRLGLIVDIHSQKINEQRLQANKEKKRQSTNYVVKQNEQQASNRVKQINKQKKKIKSIFHKIKLSMNIKFFVQKLLLLIYKKQYIIFQNNPQYQQIIIDKSSSYYDSSSQKFKFSESVNQNQQGIFANQFYQNASYYDILISKLKLKEKLLLIIDKFPVFLPFSINRMIWDTLQLVMLSFYFILIPLQIAFSNFIANVEYTLIVAILFFIFICLDILVICNTSLFLQGKLIENRLQIFQNYKKKGFQKDIITILPLLFLIIISQTSSYEQQKRFFDSFLILFYWRFQNCRSFLKKIEIRLHFSPVISQVLKLAKLLFLNLYIIHCLACIWIMIADKNINISWMSILSISDSVWYIQYLCSFYFNTVTMVTVGYGDLTPQNHQERFLSIITVLSACGVFAYSITEVGSIFKEIQFYKKQIKQNIFIINNYMKKKNISHELQYQVRDYLEYFWNESKYQDIEAEKKIINQLSNNLKESLMIEANRAFILQSPIFNDNFTLKTILKIIPLIKEQKYNPEEVIYFQDETEDTSLYFIEKGQVEIFQASQNMSQQSQSFIALKTGSFFGENEFFTGQPRKQSFRSIEFTTLLKIEREKFLQIIKEDNGDYERYCLIRDSILNKYNIKSITRKCQLCEGVSSQNPNHLEQNCPIVHFIPNFIKIQARFSNNQSQSIRQNFKRHQSQYETLKNLFRSSQDQICFYSKNLKQINDYVQNYCQRFNLLQELDQNQYGDQLQIFNNIKQNTFENTQTYLNTNISYSSEESSDESYSSEIKSSYKKSSLSSSNNSFTMRAKQKKRTQLHPEVQIIKEEIQQGYVTQIKNQVQPSAFSRHIQQKKSENSSENSASKSESSSLDQQESSLDKSLSIKDIISQNEFFTMRDILQDPKIPSIQHLSLEEQNKNKIKRSQVNQIQSFQANSLKLVQQKNCTSLQNTNFSQSSNNQNLTFKKLSSDISSQDFLNVKELLKNRMNQKFTTDQEIQPKKIEQDIKNAELAIQEEFELENSQRKRSHSLSAQNNFEDILFNDINQNLTNEQAKQISNQQRIKINQKNHLNILRRGSHQIQKQNSQRQISQTNYNFNGNSQLKIISNSSNKIQPNFGNTQKNNSQNNLSSQNQSLLQDIKKIIETQIDQVSQNIKSIRDCFEKKENDEHNSQQSLKIDINNIEFTNLEDLDRMKLYEIYFVHNNYDKVILHQNQIHKLLTKQKDQNQDVKQNNSNSIKITSQFRHSTIFKQRIQQSQNIRNSQLLFASNLNYSNLSKLQNLRNDFSKKTIILEKNKSFENFSDQQLSKNKLQNMLEIKQNKVNSPSNYQETLTSNLGKKAHGQSQLEKEESKNSTSNKQISQNESTFSAKVDLIISESLCLQNTMSQQKQTKQIQLNRSQFYSPQVRAQKFYQKSVQSIEYLE
ncbi:cyclic nucleotide-binding domain protein (macronuclear) [Tetrahymena thermophila SB210]|uniref:Cyclic nucleotide-binding domain protein n=1 Tax=Tetrahymena thermophila (strain SB210) TaxID=312017 RepID=I7LVA4_TETTS|nr:cyclic nucleotide-binding domain protein [Tetrahymena thermophila SB210]EAR97548.2 cyclic nucleotide-binding domain protein [Tetrahymena thermophila SB210]|eukprot:XP_001017793.2 cyclic nucleotide-binding domain protein [Tetrahymena thermophila SB210]